MKGDWAHTARSADGLRQAADGRRTAGGRRHTAARFRLLLPAAAALLLGACAEPGNGVHGSGTIEAEEVTISARTTGELLEVRASEGERVASGDLLARVDHTALELELAQTQARVAAAQANLDLLLAGARREDLRQARANAAQAGEARDLARKTLERTRVLLHSESTTQSDMDRVRAEYQQALSRVESAEAQVDKLLTSPRAEEVRAARAQVAEAEAAAARIRHRIDETEIYAPSSGTVMTRMHQAGELVAPGTPLFRLADLSTVTLIVYVPEPSLSRITLGQEAAVSVDGMPERRFPGRVTHIASEAEFTPKNVQTEEARAQLLYAVEITLPNGEGVFKIGMPAEATLPVRE